MNEQFSRTALILGEENVVKLAACRVAVFGLGGVGGYVAEALARSGVGELYLIDGDAFSLSNLNRQIFALRSTIGRNKADAAAERLRDINQELKATAIPMFFNESTLNDFDFSLYDYVVDAIDNVTSKLLLARICYERDIPIISSMGAGNKLDPMAFEVADIYSTSVCPLARVMRRELKKLGVGKLKVVYSREEPVKLSDNADRTIKGSVAFVPSAAGLLIASETVKDLIKER